jgi:hypothetical protein
MSDQREIDDRELLTEAYSKFSQRRMNAVSASMHPAVESTGPSLEYPRFAYPAIAHGRDDVDRFVSHFGWPHERLVSARWFAPKL